MKINRARILTLMLAAMLLALPAAVQAQFTFTTNTDDSLNLSAYTGPGGAVIIPDTTNDLTVTSIGTNAFQSCITLTSVTIPAGITNIGLEAFIGCASLTNISVNTGNTSFSSMNGVLFDWVRGNLIDYPDGRTNGTYTVPAGVTNIEQYAFASCTNLTTITLPSSIGGFVNTIGEFAFSGCTGLRSVNITNYDEGGMWKGPTSIGASAFTFSTSLTNVFIGFTVANVGGLAFAFCTNLTTVFFESNAPPDVGTAFAGDPAAIVYYQLGTTGWGATFGGAPTEGQTSPNQFTYEVIDGLITIEHYTGTGGAVGIPVEINGDAVTSIGEGAFAAHSTLTNVIIPNSVISIGAGAFETCTNLTSVTIGDSVTGIGENAFADCPSLTSATIPNSVTSIGVDAFSSCSNLVKVTIGNSVTNIGAGAFYHCLSLTNVFFLGDAPTPTNDTSVFSEDVGATAYYLPSTTGWGATYDGIPTMPGTPPLGITTYGGQPLIIYPQSGTNFVVQMTTNLASGNWVTVTNAVPFYGVQITNAPPNAFFRLY